MGSGDTLFTFACRPLEICRFSLNLTYFSLSLNVSNFGMSVFLTQLIFGLSEVPAHILSIWLLEVLGRKVSLVATLLIGGLSVLVVLAVPQGRNGERKEPCLVLHPLSSCALWILFLFVDFSFSVLSKVALLL